MAIVGSGLTAAGIKSEFFQKLDSTTTYFQDLTTRIPSDKAKETFAFLGTVPPMRQWESGRKARGLYEESYDIENLKYEITLEVDRDELSDDQTGQIRLRIQEMAPRAAQHKDSLLNDLLVNGATAGYNSYDGVTFFNASHESGKSGTQSNILTPAATDADNPTTAEFRTALGQAIARLLSLKDDQEEPLNMAADGLVCIVPGGMYITALEALNATIVASTTNVLQGAARVIAFPRLTDASKWYLLKVNTAVRPFVWLDREPIEFTSREQDSDEGFLREKFLYGVRARYALTYGYWQHALSLDFTAA
jgi:phage major head subunit gpT-like protein